MIRLMWLVAGWLSEHAVWWTMIGLYRPMRVLRVNDLSKLIVIRWGLTKLPWRDPAALPSGIEVLAGLLL